MLKKIFISILALVALAALVSGMFRNYVKDSNSSGGSSDVQKPHLITYAPVGESILYLDPDDAENVVYNSAVDGFTCQWLDEDPDEDWDNNFAIKLDVEPNTKYKLIWRVDGDVSAKAPRSNIGTNFGYSFGEPTNNDDEWLGGRINYSYRTDHFSTIITGENTELYFYLFRSYYFTPDLYGNVADLLSIDSFAEDVQFALIKQSFTGYEDLVLLMDSEDDVEWAIAPELYEDFWNMYYFSAKLEGGTSYVLEILFNTNLLRSDDDGEIDIQQCGIELFDKYYWGDEDESDVVTFNVETWENPEGYNTKLTYYFTLGDIPEGKTTVNFYTHGYDEGFVVSGLDPSLIDILSFELYCVRK